MKHTKWTAEKILQAAKDCRNMRDFHDRYRGAEKAAKRLGILDQVFPNKEKHSTEYSDEDIRQAASGFTKRRDFQRYNPSMYNSARRKGLIKSLFPIQLNKKVSNEELKSRASLYSSRSEFEEKDPRGYQLTQKRGLTNEYCPPRMQGISRAEIELLGFLKEMVPDFRSKRFGNDYELDCYSESLQLGVEYNGHYFHSEEAVGKAYHIKKTKYFENKGIRVIHIWEYEWRDRREQVKSYLRSACKQNQSRLGARRCVFQEIAPAIAKAFLQETHIQGSRVPSVIYALGCYYQDELMGVCTFGMHHRGTGAIVLNRFACKEGVTVAGFLAKASKLAVAKFGAVYSWAHYAKSQASGYIAAGWEIVSVHPPDYFYIDSKGKVHSKQSRKKASVGTPKHITEAAHAKADGLYRVWDCGKILLVYTKSQ